jgi:outer membrane protein OmpA-like peptidoglycan-associated protein
MNLNVAKSWLLVALFGLLSSTAYAQEYPKLQLQQFRPGTGPSDFLNVYGSKAAPHLQPDFGFYLDYADNPLKIPSSTEQFNAVVESQMTLSIMANLGLFDIFEVGLLLPITLWQTAGNMEPVVPVGFDPRDAKLESFGINDLRLHAKAQIMDLIRDRVGLAVVLAGYIPVGHDDRFAGDKAFGLEGLVAADMFILRGIRLGANLGYRYRHEQVQLRDAFISDGVMWGLAAQIPLFVDSLDFVAELDGVIGVASKPQGQEGIRGSEVPVELKAAVRYALHKDWTITTGMGFGMNDEAVGTPDLRVFVGVGGYWVSGGAWGYDYDGDGIYGVYDKCPMEAEDFDGHEDDDGCPDFDNDADGIPDEVDKCPFTPPGVAVGPDGCPDNDLDGDGIPNDIDKCPEDPEDFDRFEDSDGCPDPDNDADGIPDTIDACPMEPETFNDFMDDDGCPDDPNDKVHIARDRIIITEQVYFDTGKTTIKKESYDILDAVVKVMSENPQIVKVRIEGHTDSRGGAEMNLTLSQGRAEAVQRYMTDRGIAENRLDAIGFGLTRPIRDNETAEGRAYNRRVEFIIVEMRSY